MNYSAVGLMLTDRCTANCSVCCFKCSPRCNHEIDKQHAINFIKSTEGIPSINTIAFTGGEALLCEETLTELVSLSSTIGKQSTLITNAFWATSEQSAYAKLIELQEVGISEIGVSYDEFHSLYVPIQNIRNFIKAARHTDLGILIQSIVTTTPNLDWIIELGSDISDVAVKFFPIYPIGGAKECSDDVFPRKYPSSGCLCRKSGTAFISCDGTIWPCCSPYIMDTVLSVGNIKDIDASTMLKKFESHIVLQKLRHNGFNYFIDMIRKYGIFINIPQSVISSCELCSLFFNRQNITKFFPYILRD